MNRNLHRLHSLLVIPATLSTLFFGFAPGQASEISRVEPPSVDIINATEADTDGDRRRNGLITRLLNTFLKDVIKQGLARAAEVTSETVSDAIVGSASVEIYEGSFFINSVTGDYLIGFADGHWYVYSSAEDCWHLTDSPAAPLYKLMNISVSSDGSVYAYWDL